MKDVRYAARGLRGNLALVAVVLLTLALGIGANTAIFSVINAVLLRGLPVHDPQQLVYWRVVPGQPNGASNTGNGDSSFSESVFEQMRTRNDAFRDLIAYVPLGTNQVAVRTGTTPDEASVDMVSGNFFTGIGVRSVCGRVLTMDDEKQHTAVAVLSYGFWSRRFEQSCSAVGKSIDIKGAPFTVAGVAAKNFAGVESRPTDVWVPLQKRPDLNAWGMQQESYYADANWWCLMLMGRLQPGISEKQAAAILNPAFARAAYEHLGGKPRKGEKPVTLTFVPARGIARYSEQYAKPLWVLLAMVGLVLVVACGNVAMLLAARNVARQREFSIRMAIGGSQARLFRQLLSESFVLVATAGLLGWCAAIFLTKAIGAWADIPFSLAPDGRVLAFTIGVSALTAFLFGIAPALTALRVPIGLALKASSANASQDKGKARTARGVVAFQVALCLVLVVASGLLVRTLRNLEHVNLGFRTSGLFVFGMNPQLKAHSDAAAIGFYQDLIERLRVLPGVESVTLMQNRLGSGWSNNTGAKLDGQDPSVLSPKVKSNMMRWNVVGPGYFTTLGVPLLAGRDISDADSSSSVKVAVVNETFAKNFLGGRPALGHTVSFGSRTGYTIVGVAANSKYTGVREREIPMAYFPYTQIPGLSEMDVELRTAGDAKAFLPVVRKTIADFAPDLALLQPMTQQAQFDAGISEERLVARLSILFGGLAVLLLATGLYGTLAYSVSRRTSEIGIRMALGAQRREVLWMILRESLMICSIGLIAGIPLSIAAAHLLASLLYGLSSSDTLTIGVAIVGIVTISLGASLFPATRAASVDPIVSLRYE